jgi:sugar lactone lactonase YvrE
VSGRAHWTVAVVVAALACLACAPAALGADSIWWGNFGPSKISFANLDASGAGDIAPSATVMNPEGTAIDAAAGKIYWANAGAKKISVSDLDGSNALDLPITGPSAPFGPNGLAIDPIAGKLYYANSTVAHIVAANLDGSGAVNLNTSGATLSGAAGVAIDPAANKIYWANSPANKISVANLDNTGGGATLPINSSFLHSPVGVAIDKVAGRIYWANLTTNTISFAGLDGSGGGNLNTGAATVNQPIGVAIDPGADRIYWGNAAIGAAQVSFARLNGTGGGDVPTLNATADRPVYPSLLRSAVGTGAPAITGGTMTGATLACSHGSWAPDLLGSFLYRAPQSFAFQWSLDGVDIAGATSSTVTATAPGKYSCRVTATNHAGSATQASNAFTVAPSNAFVFGKVKLDKEKGTALLPLTVRFPGNATLSGKGLARISHEAVSAGTTKLKVKAKGKSARKLKRKGRLKVTANVAFTPNGGKANTQIKAITLKRKTR